MSSSQTSYSGRVVWLMDEMRRLSVRPLSEYRLNSQEAKDLLWLESRMRLRLHQVQSATDLATAKAIAAQPFPPQEFDSAEEASEPLTANMPQRYDYGMAYGEAEMRESESGDWVKFEDYEELRNAVI